MLFSFFRWFFKASGWQLDPNSPEEIHSNCVIIAAPHTTWWDILFTFVALDLLGIRARITVADKYAVWPIRKPLERMGAIWIDRSPKEPGSPRKSYVEAMIDLYAQHKTLAVVVTPEGTRAYRDKWKKGFYHVAKGAGVPIGLGYLDYEKKIAGVGGIIQTTDDEAADMKKIMAFYQDIAPKFPKLFSIDKRYQP